MRLSDDATETLLSRSVAVNFVSFWSIFIRRTSRFLTRFYAHRWQASRQKTVHTRRVFGLRTKIRACWERVGVKQSVCGGRTVKPGKTRECRPYTFSRSAESLCVHAERHTASVSLRPHNPFLRRKRNRSALRLCEYLKFYHELPAVPFSDHSVIRTFQVLLILTYLTKFCWI